MFAPLPDMPLATMTDREARVAGHDALEVRLWLRLVSCVDLIERELRQRLAKCGVSLARFEVMGHLDRFAEGLSMGELSERLMVSKGNVSGLFARMEREGLLERMTHPEDRRVQVMRLTKRGKTLFDSVKPIHHEVLRSLMTDLRRTELTALRDQLSLLKASAAGQKPRRKSRRG